MKSMTLLESCVSALYWAASSASGWFGGAGWELPGAQAGTLRKAIASASLACPAGVACARAAALFSAAAVAAPVS